jgi:SAM-dependent methyltransferase
MNQTTLIPADEPAWFEEWFDTPYYHILYNHRDYEEAALFIDRLTLHLKLPLNARVLDLGCGKGRHARHLHAKGLRVTGIDLSEQNITACKEFEEPGLEFYVHDMRRLFRINYFDTIMNLFTSFGYFEQWHQNELAVQAAAKSLVKEGILVIDFLNVDKAIREMVPEQRIVKEGIVFNIRKSIENGFLVKNIDFEDKNKVHNYREAVGLLKEKDFNDYFERAGLTTLGVFGDYRLNKFDALHSPRLIFIARKN